MQKHPTVVLILIAALFFVVLPLRIAFADAGQYQLTINPEAGGTTTPPAGNYTYGYATNVTVTALPDPGYIFENWIDGLGNFTGGGNPMTIMITGDVTLQPVFENATSAIRTLTILAGNNGTTNPPPGNYTCSYGENVTITAIPDTGFFLECWTDGSGNDFAESQYNLIHQ